MRRTIRLSKLKERADRSDFPDVSNSRYHHQETEAFTPKNSATTRSEMDYPSEISLRAPPKTLQRHAQITHHKRCRRKMTD